MASRGDAQAASANRTDAFAGDRQGPPYALARQGGLGAAPASSSRRTASATACFSSSIRRERAASSEGTSSSLLAVSPAFSSASPRASSMARVTPLSTARARPRRRPSARSHRAGRPRTVAPPGPRWRRAKRPGRPRPRTVPPGPSPHTPAINSARSMATEAASARPSARAFSRWCSTSRSWRWGSGYSGG